MVNKAYAINKYLANWWSWSGGNTTKCSWFNVFRENKRRAIYCIKLPEFKLEVFIYDFNLCISVSMCACCLFLNSCFLFLGNSWQTTAKRSINLAFPFVSLKTIEGESESHLNCDHHVVLPLPTLCLASEAKSPKSKSKIENKIFPCLCQKDTRGNLRLPIVFFSPSL